MITKQHILDAHKLIKDHIVETDLVQAHKISKIIGGELWLKLENLQISGSFKVRGALNKIVNLTEAEKNHGLIAASAGNHAQGVAIAATSMGIKSTIVMPKTTPLVKVTATQEYGASVVLEGEVFDDAFNKALEIQKETGATLVHPFDDPYVMAGQGTIGLEILKNLDNIDQIVVPIGGGGLISGIAAYVKEVKPEIKIIGVQTDKATAMMKSFEKGEWMSHQASPAIADGITVSVPGKQTFEVIKKHVSQIVKVTDDDISRTMLFLLEKCKVVAEGAGCASVAALVNGEIDCKNKRTVAIISGGNVDITAMEDIINRALILENRRARIKTNISKKIGNLSELIKIFDREGAIIINLREDTDREELKVKHQSVTVRFDISDKEHLNRVIQAIKDAGYQIIK